MQAPTLLPDKHACRSAGEKQGASRTAEAGSEASAGMLRSSLPLIESQALDSRRGARRQSPGAPDRLPLGVVRPAGTTSIRAR